MYYAVTIIKGSETKNTYNDWYLVPSSRPVISPPEPKYNMIDIPGVNGSLDLTEVLTGDVAYNNRKGSIEFIVFNEKPDTWYELYSKIMDFVQGQRVQIKLEEEPEYYYEGRVKVNTWTSGKNYSTISFEYDLDPFKYASTPTTRTINHSSSTTTSESFTCDRMPVMPKFTLSGSDASMTVTFKGTQYTLAPGEQAIAGIVFTEGTNTLTVSGKGSLTVTYRGGHL